MNAGVTSTMSGRKTCRLGSSWKIGFAVAVQSPVTLHVAWNASFTWAR